LGWNVERDGSIIFDLLQLAMPAARSWSFIPELED